METQIFISPVAKNIHNLHQKKNPPKETKINPSRYYYY
jgi:hypothetical protein